MNKIIKALYITNLGLLDALGSTQIIPYLKGLSDKGINISVLSYEKKKNLKDRVLCNKIKAELKAKGIEWFYLVYHHRWGNLLDVISGAFKALLIIISRDIKVLHARSSIPILIAFPIAKLLNRKVLYDRRGTMAGDFIDDINVENIFCRNKLFYSFLDNLDRFLVRHSDGVIILTERLKDIITKDRYLYKDTKYTIIPCCVDIDRFNAAGGVPPEISKEYAYLYGKNNVCYLGSLGTCYLFNEMLDFFKLWKKTFTDSKFIIISQNEQEFIMSQVKKNNFPWEDIAIIKVDAEKVPYYLKLSAVSLMFIKPVECKIGASPTKFAESFASGIPVCVNKGIGDMDDFILRYNTGAIVDDFNEASYKKAIESLKKILAEPDLSLKCRGISLKYFSLKEGIDKYYKAYNSLFYNNGK